MKPKEFDALIRQKFDQNDFGYNPSNWERLEEQLEGREKKRSIIMWWWMPLAGVAASVALAIGINAMWRQAATGNAGVGEFASTFTYDQQVAQRPQAAAIPYASASAIQHRKTAKHKAGNSTIKHNEEEAQFGINLENAVGNYYQPKPVTRINLLAVTNDKTNKKKDKKQEVAVEQGVKTFKPEAVKKEPKISIILSGGINHGSQNSGYAAGATIRRMINDKVYIESDVAFTSSNNIAAKLVQGPDVVSSAGGNSGARTTLESGKPVVVTTTPGKQSYVDASYNLSYAQVSPSIGVKIMKRMSIGAGPDFQQALADNRPATSTVDRNNIAVAPLFDLGLIGKTEYSVTKKLKAAVSYRKGINNILTPMDKYIDRDYLQVQVRCTIFNK